MGVSTDAVLFYGIDLGEEWEPPDELKDDLEGCYAVVSGESGCTLSYHCHGDYPIYYVCISESELTAHRGSSREVVSLDVPVEWREKLRAFCGVTGIPFSEPKWILASYADY